MILQLDAEKNMNQTCEQRKRCREKGNKKHEEETVEICRSHIEKRELREYDTQRTDGKQVGQREVANSLPKYLV